MYFSIFELGHWVELKSIMTIFSDCNEKVHGIRCCTKGFTCGDFAGEEEVFIQSAEYKSSCFDSCKVWIHTIRPTDCINNRENSIIISTDKIWRTYLRVRI